LNLIILLSSIFFSAAVCSYFSINKDLDSDSEIKSWCFLKTNKEIVILNHILTQLWDDEKVVEIIIWDIINITNNSNIKKSSNIII
jgi:hypothetical protein